MEMRLCEQASKPCRSLAEQPQPWPSPGLLHIPAPALSAPDPLRAGRGSAAAPFNPGGIEMSEHLLPTELEFQNSLFGFFFPLTSVSFRVFGSEGNYKRGFSPLGNFELLGVVLGSSSFSLVGK